MRAHEQNTYSPDEFTGPKNGIKGKRLLVIVHGFTGMKPSQQMFEFLSRVSPDTDVFRPRLPHDKVGCRKRPLQITLEIIRRIDEFCDQAKQADNHEYEEVMFVGHSMGGVLVRKVLLGVWGPSQTGNTIELEKEDQFHNRHNEYRTWHTKVTRVVLIAGLLRGWEIDQATPFTYRIAFKFVTALGNLSGVVAALTGIKVPLADFTFFHFKKGSSFIVDSRIQWMQRMRETYKENNSPASSKNFDVEVQMLGTTDELVSPNDTIDLSSIKFGDQSVHFIEVPYSSHSSIIHVDNGGTSSVAPEVAERQRLLLAALFGDDGKETHEELKLEESEIKIPSLKEVETDPAVLDDAMPVEPDLSVKNVVFVMHGIRDENDWTKKIAMRIKQKVQTGAKDKKSARDKWKSVTPTYGYFTIGSFLWPGGRARKVEWLMNLYADTVLSYPDADIHYVGHSNGSYLAASALERYVTCEFGRVCFAGSVVRSNFDWQAQKVAGKVERVFNYIATNDKVVALAPYSLRWIRSLDLGGAGHVGFDAIPSFVKNYRYAEGGHGAGIVEHRWDEIADFVVDGTFPESETKIAQNSFLKRITRISPYLLVLLAGFLSFLWLELAAMFFNSALPLEWFSSMFDVLGKLPVIGDVFQGISDFATWSHEFVSSLFLPVRQFLFAAYTYALYWLVNRF